jgi:type IV pilus assembly protein PilV
MMPHAPRPSALRMARALKRPVRGIALIEALVAIVILALGLLGTVGLQARSYSALADTGIRAEATMAAEKLIGLMTTDQANLSGYALATGATPAASSRLKPWYDETRAHIPGAVIQIQVGAAPAPASGNQVSVTIGWTRRAGTAPNQYRVTAYIAQAT